MNLALLTIAAIGAAVVAFTIATRDPDGITSVLLVVGGAAVAVGALAALAFVATGTRTVKRGATHDAAVARGLRRGVMVGSVVALITLLRAIDGLTPLTAAFVVAPFVVAEAVLSVRRA